MAVRHVPVLAKEVLEYLAPNREDALVVDATVGEGGHASLFLQRYPQARLVGIDADSAILGRADERLIDFRGRYQLINGWFDEVLEQDFLEKKEAVDILLFDLGISMYHFKDSGRGFSFEKDEPLDMRLNDSLDFRAYDVVNSYSREELARILREYGDERYAWQIAGRIVERRDKKEIVTSNELAEIVRLAVPRSYRYRRIHPATKTFQALRIEVNDELKRIERALDIGVRVLNDGGVIGVISFHSLEDRIVKKFFKERSKNFSLHDNQPIFQSERVSLEILTKKPITASSEELRKNPASRSAKLRVARRCV